MARNNNILESGGFFFIHNFDSGNLGHVERVPTELIVPCTNVKTNVTETPDYEFNLWTRPDCAGTEFENANRSWFYFGIQASEPRVLVRLNLINLNKQGKMYTQGMAPVTRTLPGKPQWERIRDRPVHSLDDNTFTLTFKYRTSENTKATTFFAFTYPFSFAELQIALNTIDSKLLPLQNPHTLDEIYYTRECLIYSLEGRRVDLLTISSYHGITKEREEKLKNLFPDNQERPYKFNNKKIIFMSARVHPGETPSSFVFNGFLNLLLNRLDPIAIQLRRTFVFKLVPFLNPDGVARGNYRTDTRGVNLNRVYLNPSLTLHPTVYAARALIRYYHFGCEREDNCDDSLASHSFTSRSMADIGESDEVLDPKKRLPSKPIDTKKSKTNPPPNAKRPLSANKKDMKVGDENTLSDKVCELKIHETNEDTSDSTFKVPELDSALLNPEVLRTCLGSGVQLAASNEVQGHNPMKPLRDSLKNSISLLMESGSTPSASMTYDATADPSASHIRVGFCRECRLALDKMEDTSPGISSTVPGYTAVVCIQAQSMTYDATADPSASHIRVGFCRECRLALDKMEDTSPGISSTVPGYTAVMQDNFSCRSISDARSPMPVKYSSISEYGEHQRQTFDTQCDTQNTQNTKDEPAKGEIMLCSNCFKRFKREDDGSETLVDRGDPGSDESSAVNPPGAEHSDILANPTDQPHQSPPHTDKTDSKPPPKSAPPTKKKPTANSKTSPPFQATKTYPIYKEADSGLYLYMDLHGHASKKGIFMYGNHFDDLESSVECMLLPRIMSLNNLHFHFSSCNFTERNMYLKDRRDGMSREGSGRVAVLKATGLVRSYTLECNYNTGRLVNVLPPPVRDPICPPAPHSTMPPKYTPHIYEEVGRSLGSSILDLINQHPNSRIPSSEHRNINSMRDWLRNHTRTTKPQLTMSRLRPNIASPIRTPLYPRGKGKPEERKENTFVVAKVECERRFVPPVLAQRSTHDMTPNKVKKPESAKQRPRYLSDNDKPKIQSKRRNILSIRKPSSKTQVSGVTKAKMNRRFADDNEGPRTTVLSKIKRVMSRSTRSVRRGLLDSSSDELVGGKWEGGAEGSAGGTLGDAGGASKRRPFSNNSPARLKKIRLKQSM